MHRGIKPRLEPLRDAKTPAFGLLLEGSAQTSPGVTSDIKKGKEKRPREKAIRVTASALINPVACKRGDAAKIETAHVGSAGIRPVSRPTRGREDISSRPSLGESPSVG